MTVLLRGDFDATQLRGFAKKTKDGPQARRLLALAAIYDGARRTEAAKIGGVGLQIIRDWVMRFNARGPDGRLASLRSSTMSSAIARLIESGPIPSVHGVVRWRLIGFDSMAPPSQLCAADKQSFTEDILPLLKWRCSGCHQAGGDGYEKSGIDLTTYEGVMKGTKFGRMVIAGDPESSNLMLLLDWRASPALRMPHGKKQLSKCDRDAIRAWIKEGAKNN